MYILCTGTAPEGILMAQLNLNVTPEFQRALSSFMRLRGIRTKSEAIRVAVTEGVERLLDQGSGESFSSLLGAANRARLNRHPRFHSDDDLWG